MHVTAIQLFLGIWNWNGDQGDLLAREHAKLTNFNLEIIPYSKNRASCHARGPEDQSRSASSLSSYPFVCGRIAAISMGMYTSVVQTRSSSGLEPRWRHLQRSSSPDTNRVGLPREIDDLECIKRPSYIVVRQPHHIASPRILFVVQDQLVSHRK